MSLIPVEIFRHVFGYFSNDSSSLYSCLLVNKTWCEISASILWSDPFKIKKPATSLITTYLSCLNITEREILINSGIDLKILFEKKPNFEYAEFLRSLKYMNFYELSLLWLKELKELKELKGLNGLNGLNGLKENGEKEEINNSNNNNNDDDDDDDDNTINNNNNTVNTINTIDTINTINTINNTINNDIKQVHLITRELCKLFMNKSKILYLDINLDSLILPDNVDSMLIPCFPNAKTSLSQLQEFTCCGNYDKKKMFTELSKYCKNLTKLNIDYYLDDTITSAPIDLAKLIKSQKSLQKFKIETYYRSLSKIIPALESQQKTLKEIIFRGIDFDEGVTFSPLVSCKNLETLVFMACDNVKNEATKPLEKAYFPKLKKLVFHVEQNKPPLALTSIIINNYNTLKEISLGLPPIYDSQEDPKIIETIIKYCENLVIFDSHLQIQQLLSLLISCNKLEKLIVRGREPLKADEFLPQIGKIIPFSLKSLIINAIWSFNPNTLKEFLNYCIAPLETLGFPDCYAINDDHLFNFSECAKEKGFLKVLNIKSASNITRKAFEVAKSDIEIIEHCGSYCDEE